MHCLFPTINTQNNSNQILTRLKTNLAYCFSFFFHTRYNDRLSRIRYSLRRPNIYLFIYGLFNDAISSSDYIASNNRMVLNNELEWIWKEAAVA
jgi:hypothetical protein